MKNAINEPNLEDATINYSKSAHDIHSYSLFANVDNRDGTIKGHQMFLNKEKMEAIEDIVYSDLGGDTNRLTLNEEPSYELE